MSDPLMPKRCMTIRTHEAYHGKQGIDYFAGVAAETIGSRGLCMHLLTVPPGARAKAHLHEGHETAIYVLEGEGITIFGDQMQYAQKSKAGDIVYIPAGIPHLPVNFSDVPVRAVVARTDPNEQESVQLLPHLEEAAERTIARIKSGDLIPDEAV